MSNSRQLSQCWARHPNGIYRCTLLKGHSGQHKHAYSGPIVGGWQRGTNWS